MMGVYIKGMDMPVDCYECKVWFQCFDEKPPFNMIKSVCPLVEVKEPHGRLIDADVLKQSAHLDGRVKTCIDTWIDSQETVIEAEGNKK